MFSLHESAGRTEVDGTGFGREVGSATAYAPHVHEVLDGLTARVFIDASARVVEHKVAMSRAEVSKGKPPPVQNVAVLRVP